MYVAFTSDAERMYAFNVCAQLRKAGIRTESNYQGRSLKSQFKQADKLGARLCVVIGEQETQNQSVTVRDMTTHEQTEILLANLVSELTAKL